MVRIIHFPMKEFQTIEHLIPNFGDRVEDPPAPAADQQALQQIFEDLLGQSTRFIQPVLFRSGRLIVYAQAAIWGQHIQHRHAMLLERGQAAGLYIQKIEVKVRPLRGAVPMDAPRPTSYNPENVSQQLDKLAEQTDNNQLKQTLSRLAERMRINHGCEEE